MFLLDGIFISLCHSTRSCKTIPVNFWIFLHCVHINSEAAVANKKFAISFLPVDADLCRLFVSWKLSSCIRCLSRRWFLPASPADTAVIPLKLILKEDVKACERNLYFSEQHEREKEEEWLIEATIMMESHTATQKSVLTFWYIRSRLCTDSLKWGYVWMELKNVYSSKCQVESNRVSNWTKDDYAEAAKNKISYL